MADFIGDVNIISGRAKPSGDKVVTQWAEGQPDIIGTTATKFDAGQEIHFAIRPEKVAISTEEPQDAANKLQGKVLDIAYLGNISTYHVELPTGNVIKAQTANTRRLSRREITWEDKVWISFTDTAGVLLER